MSRFSGKCDFYDTLDIYGDGDIQKGFEYIKDAHIYIGDSKNQLKFSTLEELVPYFPHVITSGGFDNKNGANTTIYLTEKSWVEIKKDTMSQNSYNYYTNMLQEEIKKYKKDH